MSDETMMVMTMRELGPHLVMFVAIVLGITLVVAVAGAVLTADSETVPIDRPTATAYDVESITTEPTPASGSVSIDIDGNGTVLIDRSHQNDVEHEDVEPLTRALHNDGHDVQYLDDDTRLDAQLANASAFVVIDPQTSFEHNDVDAIDEFVAGGGRLLIVSEPNRAEVRQVDVMTMELSVVRSEANSLANHFDLQFGTTYLYNLEENDGNYRNVFAEPTDEDVLTGVERTTMSTATAIESPTATSLLDTIDGTEMEYTESDTFSVAMETDGVIAVGDASFMTGTMHNVGDNNAFIEAILTYLLTGSFDGDTVAPVEYESEADDADDETTDNGDDAEPEENDDETDETEEIEIDEPVEDDDEEEDDDDDGENDGSIENDDELDDTEE